MPNSPLLSILSDQPADDDQLNFRPYAKTLADIVADAGTHTPLTIGVFGGWGRGKTSLMRMVQSQLKETEKTKFPVYSVWFNAWLYSREEAVWRALVARVLQEVQHFDLDEDNQSLLERLEARLYQPFEPGGDLLTLPAGQVPGLESAAQVSRAGLELWRRQAKRAGEDDRADRLQEILDDVKQSDALTRRDRLVALDDFRREFKSISEHSIKDRGRLAVFVDDLDRCLPDRAVEVLEAIKLFLDVPGCVFVLGIARDVIEEGIRVRYKGYETRLDGALYLEKIIQIPFSLPPIATEMVEDYVEKTAGSSLPDPRCTTVFAVGLEPNPRRIKRTLNIFLLLWRLSLNREEVRSVIKPVRLAKMVIIQQYHPKLYELITEAPRYLIELERYFREQEVRDGDAVEQRTGVQAEEMAVDFGAVAEDQYSILAIRNLIRDAFTARALRRFVLDSPTFRPVLDDFGPSFSLDDMVDVLLEYCRTHLLLTELLEEIQQVNPKQFQRYSSELVEREAVDRAAEQAQRSVQAQGSEVSSAGPLSEFLERSLLRSLLTSTALDETDTNFADLSPPEVREYIYLTRSTVKDDAEEAAPEGEEILPLEPQMVTIPVGPFKMGTPRESFDELTALGIRAGSIEREMPQDEIFVDTYALGRYPVTNAEFARFVQDGGYDNAEYWTTAGWTWRTEQGRKQPRFWEQAAYNDPSHPVVGVSWYEAVAYCKWLEFKTGKPYRLPTEAEWEKGARGMDGRRYPWGDDWDSTLCNNRETGPGRTSPVGSYSPDGDSFYGVSDMAGQVWEWCSSKFSSGEPKRQYGYPYRPTEDREDLEGDDVRILRGSSWNSKPASGLCRCAFRGEDEPFPRRWHDIKGFRCAMSPLR